VTDLKIDVTCMYGPASDLYQRSGFPAEYIKWMTRDSYAVMHRLTGRD
jgi:hypothetical protein